MSTSLTATKIKDTYGQLLHLDGGVTSTLKTIYDGDGTATGLKISTTGIDPTGITLTSGTANGVAYLNGSKVVTTGSALTFDGTVFTVTKPTAYNTRFAYDASYYTDIGYGGTNTVAPSNPFYYWNLNSSEQMRLTSTGLGIGTSSIYDKLEVSKSASGALGPVIVATNPAGSATGNAASIGFRTNSGFLASGYYSARIAAEQESGGAGAISTVFYRYNGSTPSGVESMRLDSSGNLGLGVTPSAWGGNFVMSQYKGGSIGSQSSSYLYVAQNGYYDGSNWKYVTSNYATATEQGFGAHKWYTASSGIAGNAITFTQAMTLDAGGNLALGQTTAINGGSGARWLTVGTPSTNTYSGGVIYAINGTAQFYQYQDVDNLFAFNGDGSNAGMKFGVGGSERMRIDSSGNVGIGTSSVNGKLNVATSGGKGFEFYPDNTSGTNLVLNYDRTGAVYQNYAVRAASHQWLIGATEQMRLDSSGNLGLGVTPSAWDFYTTFQVADSAFIARNNNQTGMTNNAVHTSGGVWKYINSNYASFYQQYAGQHIWKTAPSGTAGNAISFTQAMTLDASGNLGVGVTSPTARLDVNGTANIVNTSWLTFGGANTIYSNASVAGGLIIQSPPSGENIIFRNSSGTERMRIDSSGNVGIGTSSPGAKFHVRGGNGDQAIFDAAAASRYTQVYWNNNGTNKGTIWADNTDSMFVMYGYSGMGLAFYSNATERMRIDSSGNVLVGTSTAYGKFAVVGTNFNFSLRDDISNYCDLASRGASTTYGGFVFKGIRDSDGAEAERMRIDSSGNLLVGGTSSAGINLGGGFYVSPYSQQTFSVTSHVSGTSSGAPYSYFYYADNQIGSITQNGTTAVAYNTSSDYRLKENIQPMQNALGVVAQLNPVTYNWKADGSDGQGFIAHELQAVVPDCVTGEKDAVDEEGKPVYQGIDTSFLVATLTAAIKELKAELDATKAEVAALKAAN